MRGLVAKRLEYRDHRVHWPSIPWISRHTRNHGQRKSSRPHAREPSAKQPGEQTAARRGVEDSWQVRLGPRPSSVRPCSGELHHASAVCGRCASAKKGTLTDSRMDSNRRNYTRRGIDITEKASWVCACTHETRLDRLRILRGCDVSTGTSCLMSAALTLPLKKFALLAPYLCIVRQYVI